MAVERFIRDGKVAVLYSPGFGAGWSTWASEHGEKMLFDPVLVEVMLDKSLDLEARRDKVREIASERYPREYLGGICDLTVIWLDLGTPFCVDEYDGSESIRTAASFKYVV